MSPGEPPARTRSPLLDVSLARSKALFDELARIDRVDARWRAVEAPILEAFDVDRRRYSEVLEPSISADARGCRVYRFSYGMPGFRGDGGRGDGGRGASVVLAVARVVGGAADEAAQRFLRAVAAPCVEQPLVGFAHDAAGAPVLKLYLQFRGGADAAARQLAARVLGDARPLAPIGGALHLLGLDVSAVGLARARLYALHPTLAWAAAARDLDVDPALVPRATLRDALLIHERRAPDDPAADLIAVDLPLRPQGLAFAELASRLASGAPAAVEAMAHLEARFRLVVRRVSIGAGARPKLNLYYALAETESGAKPSAGG